MGDRFGVAQLRALVWLKWALFRNAMRSRRGAANRAASAATTAAALALSLLVAAGVGAAAYALAGGTDATRALAERGGESQPLLLLFGLAMIVFLTWGLLPLSLGSGSQFDPGPLLLYPVSLRRLFLIDLLSETTSLASLFAVPSLLALGLGAGLARGRVGPSLVAACAGVLFGLGLSKLLATAVVSLLKRKRTRGETLLALLGLGGAFSGLIVSRGLAAAERAESFPAALEWTPPGALVVALTAGDGEHARYVIALATLVLYAVGTIILTYKIAARALNSSGGSGRARASAAAAGDAGSRVATGWRLPFGSEQLSAVFEKEARYALRNAQLRVMVLMPAVVTVALSFGLDQRRGFDLSAAGPYFEGVRPALGMYYLNVILSSLTSNLFGYDGPGVRAFVLSPAPRRTILLGKNLAMLCASLAGVVVVTITNRLMYGPLPWRAHLFGALSFLFFAAVFATVGNWLSARYPKRIEFGKRMNASGMAGLLMVPVMFGVMVPPALAVLAGWAAGRAWVGYAILAAFAAVSVAAYWLSLGAQGRELERRELEVLEAVARRDES
ncbi:MAG TPA: hypothetical protein VK421_04865 [Pyrinomonadaceae bacterium]|nr:hypothetical protein [Pyrinomonadaceae bacterium]